MLYSKLGLELGEAPDVNKTSRNKQRTFDFVSFFKILRVLKPEPKIKKVYSLKWESNTLLLRFCTLSRKVGRANLGT